MKLRNKRTGEISDVSSFDTREFSIGICYDNKDGYEERTAYDSLAELNEEWEDADDTNVPSKPSIEQRIEWLFKLTDEHDRRLSRIENDLDDKVDKKPINAERVNELISEINKEPLIKDEKIRKAVRAWGYSPLTFVQHRRKGYCSFWYAGEYICFKGLFEDLKDGKLYAVAELCGEEE